MNYNVLQNNKFELIPHKLTFKLVGTTATIITTIKGYKGRNVTSSLIVT